MKTDIKQHLCNTMWRFVKNHAGEIEDSYENLGFKNKTDMLNAIKFNWETAYWALTELCEWSMTTNYNKKLFFVEEGDDYSCYKLGKRYFKKAYNNPSIVEVKPVVKTIKVLRWEEVEDKKIFNDYGEYY